MQDKKSEKVDNNASASSIDNSIINNTSAISNTDSQTAGVTNSNISNKTSGGSNKLLIGCGIAVVLVLCCVVVSIAGLAISGASIFTLGSVEVSAPTDLPAIEEKILEDTPSPEAESGGLIVWPNTAYYLIGCDFYEVTPTAASRITAITGFPTVVGGDYCYTGSFGDVSAINSKLVLAVQNGSTGNKEAFYVDLTARTARRLPRPADVSSPNVLRTDYAFNPSTNMTMVYQLVGSGDRTEPRLKEISATGAERDIVAFESRMAAGRGGTIGDEVSLVYSPDGRYILINDTTAGPISPAGSESFVAVVDVATGRRLASIEGLKARWVSPTQFIYQSASLMGSSGDRKLYSYDVTTERSNVLTTSETFGTIAHAFATDQGYILTEVSSPAAATTKLINRSTGRVTEISANALAQTVGSATYHIELRRCEITDVFGGETESRPGAVLCPMGDAGGIYTHRLMRFAGGSTSAAAEFGVRFPF